MKKTITISVFILFSVIAFSQSANAIQNYKKGTKAIKLEKYKDGISYLTLSIDESPTSDAYYNRAAAYYYLGDTCQYCDDLKKAALLKDADAEKLFLESCTHPATHQTMADSLKDKFPNLKYLEVTHNTCNSDSSIMYVYEFEGKEFRTTEITKTLKAPIYTIVEKMPEFKGGDNAMQHFLANNIIYPATATKFGIEGTVYLSFVIDQNGTVIDAKIIRGIGGGCDEEALRVVKKMPKWIPGTQDGKKVRVLFNMPIYFKLKG